MGFFRRPDVIGTPQNDALFLFRVPLILTVNAAAILLAVKLHRFGDMAAIGVALAQVGIKEAHTILQRDLFADFFNQIVLLVRADKQA